MRDRRRQFLRVREPGSAEARAGRDGGERVQQRVRRLPRGPWGHRREPARGPERRAELQRPLGPGGERGDHEQRVPVEDRGGVVGARGFGLCFFLLLEGESGKGKGSRSMEVVGLID